MKRKAGFLFHCSHCPTWLTRKIAKTCQRRRCHAAGKQNVMTGQKTTHEIIFKLLQEDILSIGI
ncbi:hypothetical protein [Methylobacter sp. YRD-M1]|uniref:hypothetical protein n=1 Tax=Methylobacter sp. YRD-M1 TaxID=2911520 RepID=UPI00227AD84D|nr:hypothetical protein [Methylobacter sp. YRD-M1]WAK02208.1 hypothetical protein LZ558_00070 [Methylobacter sp. YRD-M1]